MSDYFVNLEKLTTGSGSVSDPYGATQFFDLSYYYTTPGDIFHLKGMLSTPNRVVLGSDVETDMTLTSWSPEINGPWRIQGTNASESFYIFNGSIEGGILSYNNNVYIKAKFLNTILDFPFVVFTQPSFIKGSIIRVPHFETGCGTSIDVNDSLFDVESYSINPGCVFTKCSFRGDFPTGTIIDCAKDWTASFPSWDASKTAWRIDSFIQGLDSSVKTGSYPYTGYATDLWGNPRSRIGSGYMPGSSNYYDTTSVSDGSSIISHAYPEYLVETIQNKGADTYFDTTSEISRAVVFYTHQDGRQNKRIVHTAPNYTAAVSWPSGARDGTWQKTVVKVYDTNNAVAVLSRSDMDSSHDLVHSGGAMTLNVA